MKNLISIIIISIFVHGCGLTPKKIEFDNPELKPLWEAMKRVNRDSLGFTKINKNSNISLEGKSRFFEKPYDKMLHVFGATSRTIAFKELDSGKYVWIGEQEIFTGPKTYETTDGIMNEMIVINYDKVRISGMPTNVLYITYNGPEEKLSLNPGLKLNDVKPLIAKWLHK